MCLVPAIKDRRVRAQRDGKLVFNRGARPYCSSCGSFAPDSQCPALYPGFRCMYECASFNAVIAMRCANRYSARCDTEPTSEEKVYGSSVRSERLCRTERKRLLRSVS